MSRKVLDVSTQSLVGVSEEANKLKTTYERIKYLVQNGLLTKKLGDWAHELRLGGNDASHDAGIFSIDDARDLLGFAELYLIYVYTLPERLEEQRARRQARNEQT